MRPNILITGAAGYMYGFSIKTLKCTLLTSRSGGSLVADFLANNVLDKDHLLAAVRSEGQAQALSMFGIQVLRLDLTDEASVVQNVTQHNGKSSLPHLPSRRLRYISQHRHPYSQLACFSYGNQSHHRAWKTEGIHRGEYVLSTR